MYRDERYKIVVYHGHEQGELYDLQEDPGEFNNLWDDSESVSLRFDLMRRNFDALAFSVDTRTAPDEAVLIYAQTYSCIWHDEDLQLSLPTQVSFRSRNRCESCSICSSVSE